MGEQKVLVIAPHIDDDILGCGGSMIKHVQAGNTVYTLYVSSGENSSIREKEAQDASEFCGIQDCFFLREKSRPIRYSQELLEKIVSVLSEVLPDYLYVPHNNETDTDHKTTCEILSEARWLYEEETSHKTKAVLYYEVWTPLSEFNYIEDITEVMDKKIACMEKFSSQLAVRNYIEAVVGLNKYRGNMTGNCDYAEVFKINRIQDIGMFGRSKR